MDKREQVEAQCRAVVHLAEAVAEIHKALRFTIRADPSEAMMERIGARTAALMETLGDVLNGMDAVSEDDAWTDPIFAEAQRLWPQDLGEADKILGGLKEVLDIARGDRPATRIFMDGHYYVPEAAQQTQRQVLKEAAELLDTLSNPNTPPATSSQALWAQCIEVSRRAYAALANKEGNGNGHD